MRLARAMLSVLAAALACGCAQDVWVEKEILPPFDHSFIKKIAVVEFENRTPDRTAGKIVADRIEQLLVGESGYAVVTRMDLERILREHKLSLEGLLSTETMKDLGKIAGVEALVLGSVEAFELEETQIKPLKVARNASVILCIKTVDAITGQVVFSKTARGSFFWRGWTDTDSAVGPRECLQGALDDAMTDVRVLFPHKVKVREPVE